jgi:hypothetical protein
MDKMTEKGEVKEWMHDAAAEIRRRSYGNPFGKLDTAKVAQIIAAHCPQPNHAIVEKLRKRAAYLRKCFHENPSSMVCLADELDRQAEEIEDCTVEQPCERLRDE